MMMMMMGGGGMEEVMCELSREELNEQGLPPGFRFHPTDEELITFYLASKVFNGSFSGVDIAEVDLNRCEPWDLPDIAKMGEREWYFFSLRDRKYPTGLRTNRATGAGYWKATGKDREVHSASTGALLGMKKTLVFYKGRAPRGQKTKWVMHEYRLDGDFSYRHTCKEEWVICRIFHKTGEKKNPMFLGGGEHLGGYHHSGGGGGGIRAAVVGSASLPALLDAQSSTLLFEAPHHPTLLMQAPATVSNPNPNPFLEHGLESNEQLLKALIVSHSSSSPALAFPMHNNNNNNNISSSSGGFQSSCCTSSSSFSTTTTPSATASNKINGGSNTTTTSTSTSTSVLFKSLLSHQECSFKQEQTPTAVPKQCKTEVNFSHFQLPDANMHWVDRVHSSNLLLHHHHHHHHHHQNPLLFEMDYDDDGGVFGGDAAATAADTTTTTAAAHDMSTSSIAFNRAGFQMMLDFPIRLPGGESWPLDP